MNMPVLRVAIKENYFLLCRIISGKCDRDMYIKLNRRRAMKNLLEYTVEIAFLNMLLKKEMINENEYKDIKKKIKSVYSVDKKNVK